MSAVTIPQSIPAPLELAWTVEVRRGLSVWHIRPDEVDRYISHAESAVDNQIHRRCDVGVLHLDESDLAAVRDYATRSPR